MMKDQSSVDIKLIFEGNAVDEGWIDIEDLSDGLLGFKNTFERIKDIEQIPLESTLRIKAFNKGSFESEIILQTIENQASLFEFGRMLLQIPNTIWSLIIIRKTLKGESPDKIEKEKNKLILKNNGQSIELPISNPEMLFKILKDDKVIKGLNQLVRPLEEGKIDSLKYQVGKDSKESIKIDIEEKKYFSYSGKKEIHTKREKLIGEIRSLDKKTNNGKFIYNQKTISMSLRMEEPSKCYHLFAHEGLIEVDCELEINEELAVNKMDVFDMKKVAGNK